LEQGLLCFVITKI